MLKLCDLLLKYKISKKRCTIYISCSTLFSHETNLKTFVLHCMRSGQVRGLRVHFDKAFQKVFWCVVWISHAICDLLHAVG